MKITLKDEVRTLPSLTRVQAMETLGITRHPLDRLTSSGFLPDTRVDHVAALAARRQVSCDEPMVILRSDMRLKFTDDELKAAVSNGWTCDPDDVLKAGHFLVSVASWCVALFVIRGLIGSDITVTDKGTKVLRHRFDVEMVARVDDLIAGKIRHAALPPGHIAPLLDALGHRVPSPQGSPLIIIRP